MSVGWSGTSPLGDKNVMADCLFSQKSVTKYYDDSVLEAATPDVRRDLMQIHAEERDAAFRVWQEMNRHGWYDVKTAPQSQLLNVQSATGTAGTVGAVGQGVPTTGPGYGGGYNPAGGYGGYGGGFSGYGGGYGGGFSGQRGGYGGGGGGGYGAPSGGFGGTFGSFGATPGGPGPSGPGTVGPGTVGPGRIGGGPISSRLAGGPTGTENLGPGNQNLRRF